MEPGQGGETSLPLAEAINGKHVDLPQGSECANRMGVALRPNKVRPLPPLVCYLEGVRGRESCVVCAPRTAACQGRARGAGHAPMLQGDALLFWDMQPDGNTTDRRALHASCPTTSGMKWCVCLVPGLWLRLRGRRYQCSSPAISDPIASHYDARRPLPPNFRTATKWIHNMKY
jgi:hypothetical protein